jgi:crotonobetainyl-CoA:carnitine CoA-transferase CaiB-like acyl-CoA transferase
MTPDHPLAASVALGQLWRMGQLPEAALSQARLTGREPVLASSFAVSTAAQVTIAAAALAACELGHLRGAARQQVHVDMVHAALECSSWFSLNGVSPDPWDQFSGLYACADGWVRVHANFVHHRDGALQLLGLDPASATRADAEKALLGWRATEFETAAADAGLVATALRDFAQWDLSGQGQAVAAQALFTIERIGDAPALVLPHLAPDARPLTGMRVLDLTRILAGPVGTRAMAAYGADVLLVNSPHLPNIEAIADTSRGKLSAHADLRTAAGQHALRQVLSDAHVFVQGYRPGGLAALGFGPTEIAQQRPGIVLVSLSAYGPEGPWSGRRGFDSLVQTGMGFNHAEGQALGDGKPRPMPMQILDHATGYLIAFGAAAALVRQQKEGGSWQVRVSLAQTGQWLRGLGRVTNGFAFKPPDRAPYLEKSSSGFGDLLAFRHSAELECTPARWVRPSMPPGSHAMGWPT